MPFCPRHNNFYKGFECRECVHDKARDKEDKAKIEAKRKKQLLKVKLQQSQPKPAVKKVSKKMKANPHKHKEIYWKYFGYNQGDFIPCEMCGNESVDIHHIDARGMGGDPQRKKDVIENLQALCRKCHDAYGDKTEYMGMLLTIHSRTMRPKQTI